MLFRDLMVRGKGLLKVVELALEKLSCLSEGKQLTLRDTDVI